MEGNFTDGSFTSGILVGMLVGILVGKLVGKLVGIGIFGSLRFFSADGVGVSSTGGVGSISSGVGVGSTSGIVTGSFKLTFKVYSAWLISGRLFNSIVYLPVKAKSPL